MHQSENVVIASLGPCSVSKLFLNLGLLTKLTLEEPDWTVWVIVFEKIIHRTVELHISLLIHLAIWQMRKLIETISDASKVNTKIGRRTQVSWLLLRATLHCTPCSTAEHIKKIFTGNYFVHLNAMEFKCHMLSILIEKGTS